MEKKRSFPFLRKSTRKKKARGLALLKAKERVAYLPGEELQEKRGQQANEEEEDVHSVFNEIRGKSSGKWPFKRPFHVG